MTESRRLAAILAANMRRSAYGDRRLTATQIGNGSRHPT
jgi:hypothetical protein